MKPLLFAIALFTFALSPLRAQDEAAALAKGDQLLKGLAPQPEATAAAPQTFEAFLADQSVGYAVLALAARKDAAGLVHDYSHEIVLRLPDGAVIRTRVSGVLSATYTPQSLRLERKATAKTGAARTTLVELNVQGRQVSVTTTENGKSSESKAELPAGATVVFGIEAFLGKLIATSQEPFALRELQPDSGAVKTVTFSTIAMPDGSFRVSASRDGASVHESYLVANTGTLLEFGDPNSEFAERPCTAKRFEELKAGLDR